MLLTAARSELAAGRINSMTPILPAHPGRRRRNALIGSPPLEAGGRLAPLATGGRAVGVADAVQKGQSGGASGAPGSAAT
jgi:hypothetical protein